ncbi:MAG TPA: hypothetical protein VGZ22_12070 [Isosphaeraceae bacterium]|jgi:hypothetical protein|nr:hypothetical protein [Isosphaeraceae bacterium]
MKRLVLLIVLVLFAWHMVRRSCIVACEEPQAATVISIVQPDAGNNDQVSTTIIHGGKPHSVVIHPRLRVPREVVQDVQPPMVPTPPLPPAPAAVSVEPAFTFNEAEATPKWFLADERTEKPTLELRGLHSVKGRQSITKERADGDARRQLESVVSDWLRPEVPRTWKAPRRFLDAMIIDRHVEPAEHDYGLTYKAGYQVDYSPETRGQIIQAYYREVGTQRMVMLGGLLAFVLVCLAALSGYIRADEATKGYYTNRLRVVTALAVGVAGGALLHILS